MKKFFVFVLFFLFCFGVGFAGTVPFRNGTVEIPNGFQPLPLPEVDKRGTSVEGAGYFNNNGDLIMLFSLSVGADVNLDSPIIQKLIYEKFQSTDVRTCVYAGKKILTAISHNDGEVAYFGCFIKNGIFYSVHYSEKNPVTNKKIISPLGKQLVFSIINSFYER